jgi:hypothetical protein
MNKRKPKSAVRAALKVVAPPPAISGPGPAPLPPLLLHSIQGLLSRIEATTPQLRAAGAFEVLGLLVQAGHALKHVADHALELERALGLDKPAAAAAADKPHTNGVPA